MVLKIVIINVVLYLVSYIIKNLMIQYREFYMVKIHLTDVIFHKQSVLHCQE